MSYRAFTVLETSDEAVFLYFASVENFENTNKYCCWLILTDAEIYLASLGQTEASSLSLVCFGRYSRRTATFDTVDTPLNETNICNRFPNCLYLTPIFFGCKLTN